MDALTAKRFNLLDVLVLVAATATGLALGRTVVGEGRATAHDAVANYAVAVALLWAVALFALNLTRYRAPRRDLACRPGSSAEVAIIVDRLADMVYYAIVFPRENPLFPSVSLSTLLAVLQQLLCLCVANVVRGSSCAGVVAAVWIVTALAGCWRLRRLGSIGPDAALGVFWFVIAVTYWMSMWAFPPPILKLPPMP